MKKNPLSDVSSRKKREPKPKVSFARDIRPLFRAVDISHMKSYRHKVGRLHLHVEAGHC